MTSDSQKSHAKHNERYLELSFSADSDFDSPQVNIWFTPTKSKTGLKLNAAYNCNTDLLPVRPKRIPMHLSKIRDPDTDSSLLRSINSQLDQSCAQMLIDAGLDDLLVYALVYHHPALKELIKYPLILLVIAYRFPLLRNKTNQKIAQVPDYRVCLPLLLNVSSLSRSAYRTLAKIPIRDPRSTIIAAARIAKYFQTRHQIFARFEELAPPTINVIVKNDVELLLSKWLPEEFFTCKDIRDQILQLTDETKYYLAVNMTTNWRQTLYHQPRTLVDVLRLNHRLFERLFPIPESLSKRAFPDFGITDTRHCKLVRTPTQLINISKEFHNCVGDYVYEGVSGETLHIIYQNGTDKSLLQIDIKDPSHPRVTEFKAPWNQYPSQAAWREMETYLITGFPLHGKINKLHLLAEFEITEASGVFEPKSHYSFFGQEKIKKQ